MTEKAIKKFANKVEGQKNVNKKTYLKRLF